MSDTQPRWRRWRKSEYLVSREGRVVKERRGQAFLNVPSALNKCGKPTVQLKVDGIYSTYVVERLVGELFCGSYSKDKIPHYKDGNRENVNPKNVKWKNRGE